MRFWNHDGACDGDTGGSGSTSLLDSMLSTEKTIRTHFSYDEIDRSTCSLPVYTEKDCRLGSWLWQKHILQTTTRVSVSGVSQRYSSGEWQSGHTLRYFPYYMIVNKSKSWKSLVSNSKIWSRTQWYDAVCCIPTNRQIRGRIRLISTVVCMC